MDGNDNIENGIDALDVSVSDTVAAAATHVGEGDASTIQLLVLLLCCCGMAE